MPQANLVGMALSTLAVIYSIIAAANHLPGWTYAVAWIIVGFYWAFGRQLLFGEELRAMGRNRNRNRGSQ
jgi:glucose uptake protein GlcU